jgi:DNA-binding IclR family transcriptional regulator
MIKVLSKTFGILEEIALASPHPMALAVMASKLKLNKATCSRILKDLSDAGYVEKVSREAGYTVGPRAFAFSKQFNYNSDLINASEPHIQACASELKASIILVELKNLQRYILAHHNYSGVNLEMNELAYSDVLETATGVLLMAHKNIKERKAALEMYGMSHEYFFSGISDKKGFHRILDDIKENNHAYFDKTELNSSIYAVPVVKNNQVIAALGATFLGGLLDSGNKDAALNRVRVTAEHINKSLSGTISIG